MAIHFRMIDSLSEVYALAVSQGKIDMAEVILKAIEIEQDKYGEGKGHRTKSMDMLAVARERQKVVMRELASPQ